MLSTNFRRIIRVGVINFWRNRVISAALIFVGVVTLYTIGALILAGAFLGASVEELKDKIDINVYFNIETDEADILLFQKQLENLPETERVEYLSRQEVLDRFSERHEDDSLTLQSLEVLGENPLRAVLNVKAFSPEQYSGISDFLDSQGSADLGDTDSIINEVNYKKNQIVIDRLIGLIDAVEKISLLVGGIMIIMVLLVAFNTTKLAIYNAREEISVMKLVGANASFIRGPFIVESTLYGIISAVLAVLLLYPSTLWFASGTKVFFGGIDLSQYFRDNFFQIFFIILISGILIAIFSSYMAVRRHLARE